MWSFHSKHLLRYRAIEKIKFSLNYNTDSVKNLIENKLLESHLVTVQGWVKSVREHKETVFLQINDGSSCSHLQVVATEEKVPSDATYGSCVEVVGRIEKCVSRLQDVEMKADKITVIGSCNFLDYPFKAKKKHPLDYLRQFPHLRLRTLTFGALLRIRNAATQAIHHYFQNEGFCQIHTPILTSNDCEGAGEVFKVEPFDTAVLTNHSDQNKAEKENTDHFFGTPTFLTVSGQFHLEVANGSFSKVYTFGPTFRAENSHTRHHLSEFYMVEAEMAFTDSIEDLTKCVEGLLKFTTKTVLDTCRPDFDFFLKNVSSVDHMNTIDKFLNKPFLRLTYTEAIAILEKAAKSFDNQVKWGIDLHKEHERYLVEYCDRTPVFVTDYPSEIKPFYAKSNSDGKTVAAVDLLVAGVGEVCGGSLREDRLEELERRIYKLTSQGNLDWYVDLRRFGSCPHGGFGIGFERYIQMLLGIQNIRDTLPFPRTRNNCKL